MTNLGYKSIFEEANELSKEVNYKEFFPDFHHHPELFHFIVAPESQLGSDGESLMLASRTSRTIALLLTNKGPSLVGNGSIEIDGVESRHILLMTLLLKNVQYAGSILEIGGGYGNCFRLIADIIHFEKWTIIDLDYILDLQKWALTENGIDISNVEFISYKDKEKQRILNPDLVLGIHSLSEFSLEDFISYYEIIKSARWFFYVTQRSGPSTELLRDKLNLILKDFIIYLYMPYENSSSIAYLFRNKVAE